LNSVGPQSIGELDFTFGPQSRPGVLCRGKRRLKAGEQRRKLPTKQWQSRCWLQPAPERSFAPQKSFLTFKSITPLKERLLEIPKRFVTAAIASGLGQEEHANGV
jgi:hypothetical protein